MCCLAAAVEQTISEAGADRMQTQICQNTDAAASAKGFSHTTVYFAKSDPSKNSWKPKVQATLKCNHKTLNWRKKIQAATFACTDEKKSILNGSLLHTWWLWEVLFTTVIFTICSKVWINIHGTIEIKHRSYYVLQTEWHNVQSWQRARIPKRIYKIKLQIKYCFAGAF